jgi:two-component SAPR family response regulator
MKIAVADDEAAALSTFIYNIADSENLTCSVFLNKPLQLLDYAAKNILDAAFLDIVMPEIDGVDLAEQLIAIRPEIRIVFISSYVAEREKEIRKKLGSSLIGFCSKPYDRDLLFRYIGEIEAHIAKKRTLKIRTFGCFDLFVNGLPVSFQNAKSKELLALLTDKNGAYLTMDEAAALLWPEKNAERGRAQYRDVIYRLRMVLREHNLLFLISVERGKIRLNQEGIQCDYWDYLNGIGELYGLYMPSYDWASEKQSKLESRK